MPKLPERRWLMDEELCVKFIAYDFNRICSIMIFDTLVLKMFIMTIKKRKYNGASQ